MKTYSKPNPYNLWLFGIFSCSVMLLFMAGTLSAASVDDLTFTLINEDTEYAVTDCADSATGTLTIPASYEGKPVTEIGEFAFSRANLTSVELPAGLRGIGRYAFHSSSIESIDLPAGLTALGNNAFFNCGSLTGSVTIPSGITEIPGSLFSNTALTEVILHNAVTSIGERAFYYSNLQSISLPASLNDLGSYAFGYCSALTGSVTLPSGITEIPPYLFYGTALTEVILHDAVTSIGANAFTGTDLQSIRLPASLTALGAGAFENTSYLATVRLDGAAPSLGVDAFLEAGREVAGGTRFYIQYEQQASYQNSADWSGFTFTLLGDPNAPLIEAFVLSMSLDARSNRFTIHSHGEPSNASALVLVQQSSSLSEGKWTAVDSADITVSRDSESGVVTRAFSLSPSAESGFYRLHYSASQSGQ